MRMWGKGALLHSWLECITAVEGSPETPLNSETQISHMIQAPTPQTLPKGKAINIWKN